MAQMRSVCIVTVHCCFPYRNIAFLLIEFPLVPSQFDNKTFDSEKYRFETYKHFYSFFVNVWPYHRYRGQSSYFIIYLKFKKNVIFIKHVLSFNLWETFKFSRVKCVLWLFSCFSLFYYYLNVIREFFLLIKAKSK